MLEELKKEARDIQSYLETVTSNNPEEIEGRMADLMVYLARSGEMMAEAKKILRRKKSAEISNTIIDIAKAAHLSAQVQNALLESIAEEENYLVDWLERIHRSCTHQLDALRSMLSYERENMRLTKTGY